MSRRAACPGGWFTREWPSGGGETGAWQASSLRRHSGYTTYRNRRRRERVEKKRPWG